MVQTPYRYVSFEVNTVMEEGAHVDNERPSPPRSTMQAFEIRRERSLHGAREHSTGWLGDVVESHAKGYFMG